MMVDLPQLPASPGAGESHDPAPPQVEADLTVVLGGHRHSISTIPDEKSATRKLNPFWGVYEQRNGVLVFAAVEDWSLAANFAPRLGRVVLTHRRRAFEHG